MYGNQVIVLKSLVAHCIISNDA